MSRQRSILVMVMVLAVGALGLDHFVLRGGGDPQPAEAGATAQALSTAATLTAQAAPELSQSLGSLADLLRLSGKLNRPAEDASERLFAPPSEPGRSELRGSLEAVAGNEAQTPEARARRLLAERRLQAILRDGRGGLVLIDGRKLRPGNTLDGFTLIGVDASGAIFEGHGLRLRLRYPTGR